MLEPLDVLKRLLLSGFELTPLNLSLLDQLLILLALPLQRVLLCVEPLHRLVHRIDLLLALFSKLLVCSFVRVCLLSLRLCRTAKELLNQARLGGFLRLGCVAVTWEGCDWIFLLFFLVFFGVRVIEELFLALGLMLLG